MCSMAEKRRVCRDRFAADIQRVAGEIASEAIARGDATTAERCRYIHALATSLSLRVFSLERDLADALSGSLEWVEKSERDG